MQRIAQSKKKNLSFVTSMLNCSRIAQGTCSAFSSFRKAPGTCLAFSSLIQSISTNSSDIIIYSYLRSKIPPFGLHYPSTPLKILLFLNLMLWTRVVNHFLCIHVFSAMSYNTIVMHTSLNHEPSYVLSTFWK